MPKPSKTKNATKKVFVTNSGKQYDIIGERGKFYLCDGAQFRKVSTLGHVEEIEIAEAEPKTPAEETAEAQTETEELTDE